MANSDVPDATRKKIIKYEKRVTEKLQPDLEDAMTRRQNLMQERKDYQDLASNVQRLLTEKTDKGYVDAITTRIPLGSDVEAQALVEDADTIFIKTQLGFWAECSLEEAPKFIQVHVADLDRRIKVEDGRIASIRTHVKLTLQALGELNQWPMKPAHA